MKIIYRLSILLIFIFLSKNSYSQDSTSIPFPKNSLKFNFLPLFVHTLSFSYEREFAKRLSFELEGGYIFPIHPAADGDEYIGIFSGGEMKAFQGYLGRASIRFFEKEKKDRNSIFFCGASLLCKYRYYNDKKLSTNDGQNSRIERWEQSKTLIAFAGEIQGGLRIYFPSFEHHLLLEVSLSVGYGRTYNKTDTYSYTIGGNPQAYSPHTETYDPYYSFNPCFKLGYAF